MKTARSRWADEVEPGIEGVGFELLLGLARFR